MRPMVRADEEWGKEKANGVDCRAYPFRFLYHSETKK